MARLIGPDQAKRVWYYTSGSKKGKEILPAGTPVPLYSDIQCSLPADVRALDGSVIAGDIPTVMIADTLEVPQFLFPDVADPVVYTRLLGGPVITLTPDTDALVDRLRAALVALQPGGGAEAATAEDLQAEADARVAADELLTPHARTITAGTGLTGGGDLSANRTLAVAYGTTAGTAAQGNDARLSDARTPTSHAAAHSSAGSDPLTLAQSQVTGLAASLTAKADLVGGLVPSAQIPAIAISEFLGVVASQAAMLALSGQKGDWATRTDGSGSTWIISGTDPTQIGSWTQIVSPADAVSSVAGRAGVVVLAKADVGLPNVDNTSDAGKPVSVAAADALAQKVSRAESMWDVRWSGVVGDGVTDDSAALGLAKAVCSGVDKPVLYIAPELNVLLNSQVDLTRVRRINAEGTITIGYTGGAGLIVGDTSTQRQSLHYYFSRVVWAGVQTNVALRFVGIKNGHIEVQHCDYMQLYANEAVPLQTSIACASFTIGRILKLELLGEGGVGWINENNFYGGSIDDLAISGTYGHNNNHWHGTSMEGAGATLTIDAVQASCNRLDLRGEAGPVCTFGDGTWSNEVVLAYVASPGTHSTPMVVAYDGGTENVFCTSIDRHMSYREIARIDAHSVGLNASSEIRCSDDSVPTPGLDRLMLRTASGTVMDTGIVPINNFLALDGGTNYYRNYGLTRLNLDSDVVLWRPTVYGYDSTGAAIDPTVTPWMLTTGGWAANAGGYYDFGTNVNFAQIMITSQVVASIRITVAPSSSVGVPFRYLRLMGYVQRPQPDSAIESVRAKVRRPLFQATIPTQGAPKVGTTVGGLDGGWTCTARVDTTLTAPALALATSITVASIAGITSGDVIGVLQDDGTTHWTTVSGAPSGSTITLTAGLTSAAASGKKVATSTWSANSIRPLGCPSGFWIPTGLSYGTSAAFTNGEEMATPIWIPRAGTITAIGMEFTAASTEATTPVVRLGLRADNNGVPGARLVDAGTVPVALGETPAQVTKTCNVFVTPGWYWPTGTVQGVTSSMPTLRVNSTGLSVALSDPAFSTSNAKFGYAKTGVTGALPASYTSPDPTNLTPKLMLQLT